KILAGFYFALRDDGFLFLGKSEALTTRRNWFAAIDLKRRVFAKVPRQEPRARITPPGEAAARARRELDVTGELVRAAGIDAIPVAYVAVDREGTLALANLHARAQFGVTPRDVGRPIQDLEISFRPVELRSRIQKAYEERHANTLRDVEWRP